MTPTPSAVLFICNRNRVRSPMAEAILKKVAGTRIFVDSCRLGGGLCGAEGEVLGVDPFVAAVMAEIGCDLSNHRAKTFEELEDASFDLVVTLTSDAQGPAAELARGRAWKLEHWPTDDPTLADGAREGRLEAYREVRDALAAQIDPRFRL
jgi:protein-tyrosine-phosphatase